MIYLDTLSGPKVDRQDLLTGKRLDTMGLVHYMLEGRKLDTTEAISWMAIHEETGKIDHLERADGSYVSLSKVSKADQEWLEQYAFDCMEYERKWGDSLSLRRDEREY